MTRIYNKKSQTAKRKFLRGKLSLSEIALWKKLKTKKLGGYKFRRQYGFGRYVVDFYCPVTRLAVELDGKSNISQKDYDKERTWYFNDKDIRVLRFRNEEVIKSIRMVLDKIKNKVQTPS